MKIEVWKSYLTRSGEVAHILGYMEGERYFLWGESYGDFYIWTETGKYYCGSESGNDLISELSDVHSVQQSIIQERETTHGDFSVNAEVSQAIKAAVRLDDGWSNLTDVQSEALDHIAGKIGRIIAGDPNFADHWIDIAGYAQLVVDRLEGKE